MLVLESCPSQTIELFLSGNIQADMVSSYLKKHSPTMQARYLELMLAMNENAVSGNLQNEMVSTTCIFFSTFSLGWEEAGGQGFHGSSTRKKWESIILMLLNCQHDLLMINNEKILYLFTVFF